jgi:ATPase subunit of ABC transporter with duplicated ATPase domains
LLGREILSRPWNSASGGERQRALLTRIFLSGAKVLVLDEPFNHLDQATRRTVEQRLGAVLGQGTAVLMISHAGGEMSATREIYLRRIGNS